jgi:hypothetical protein
MKQSFTDGVNDTFRIAAIIGACAMLVSLLMSGVKRPKLVPATRSRGSAPTAAADLEGDQRIAVGE